MENANKSLREFDVGSQSTKGSPPYLSIPEILKAWADSTPDQLGILATGRAPLTYKRLFEHVQTTIETLNALGIGRGDRVGIVLPNGPEMAVAFLAVAAGATSAPLNPAYRETDFDFYLTDLNAKALLVASDLDSPARAVAAKRNIPVIDLTPLHDKAAGLFELDGKATGAATNTGFAKPDDVALVLHTSGTTSRPKIVPLTQTNICTSAYNIRTTLALTPQDRCLNVMPLFHIHGLMGATLSSIYAGASLVCTPGFSVTGFFDWLATLEPTWYSAVPTMHQAVLAAATDHRASINNANLRFVRSSSSSLPPVVMQQLEALFNAPVIESYGMTEASHQMTSNPLPPNQRKAGSVGLPAGPDVAIMDDEGDLLPLGETGEIVIRGANVTLGYENNPEANARAFTDGWFRTGDQGRMDQDGYLTITGRLKEMINRGGENIAPREIDEALLEHPDVKQAVAFAVPHPTLGEDVAAAVILQPGATLSPKALRDYAFEKLADFKVPSQIIVVDEIPKGPTGKLQRIGLAEKLYDALTPLYTPPTDSLETELVSIWKETLDVARVGIDDNFFMLGGDSLTAAYLFAKVEEKMGEKMPLAVLFRAPTVRQLADVLRQGVAETDWQSLVPIQPEGSKPPFFFVHAHGGNVIGYRDLARRLGNDQPFYGLQSLDVGKSEVATRRFEDIAAHYISEIRTVQPSGPYFIGGWCLGGNIAYEMAQQITAAGDSVALLVMVQSTHHSYPQYHPGTSDLHRKLYKVANRLGLEWTNLMEVEPSRKLPYSVGRVRSVSSTLFAKAEKAATPLLERLNVPFEHSKVYQLKAVESAHDKSYAAYAPRPYSGRVSFFIAEKQPPGIVPDDTLGWGELLQGDVTMHKMPGYRIGMLSEPRVQIAARWLARDLSRAAQAL